MAALPKTSIRGDHPETLKLGRVTLKDGWAPVTLKYGWGRVEHKWHNDFAERHYLKPKQGTTIPKTLKMGRVTLKIGWVPVVRKYGWGRAKHKWHNDLQGGTT